MRQQLFPGAHQACIPSDPNPFPFQGGLGAGHTEAALAAAAELAAVHQAVDATMDCVQTQLQAGQGLRTLTGDLDREGGDDSSSSTSLLLVVPVHKSTAVRLALAQLCSNVHACCVTASLTAFAAA